MRTIVDLDMIANGGEGFNEQSRLDLNETFHRYLVTSASEVAFLYT